MQAIKARALYQYECRHNTINNIVFASGDEAFCELRNLSTTKEAGLENALKQALEGEKIDQIKNKVFPITLNDNSYRVEIAVFDSTQSIMTELTLRSIDETSQAYRFIFNQSPIGIFTYNRNFIIEKCNTRFVKILGSTHEQLVGMNMKTLEFKKIFPILEDALKGTTGHYEGPYLTTTSALKIHVKLTTSPLAGKRNQIIGGIGLVEDITSLVNTHDELQEKDVQVSSASEELRASNEELRAVNDALKENQEQLQLVLDSTNDGFWDWSNESGELFFSDQIYRMLDYEPNAFPASLDHWKTLIHKEDITEVEKALKSFLQEPDTLFRSVFRVKTKTNEYRWILARGKVSRRNKKGKPARITGTNQDITTQKVYEEQLKKQRKDYEHLSEKYREQNEKLEEALSDLTVNFREIEKLNAQITVNEQRYRILTENIGEGIIVADKEENITFCNPIAEKIFDEQPGNLTGENLSRFISPEAYASIQEKTDKRQTQGIDSYELTISTPKGNIKHLWVTASPHCDNHGNFSSTIGIIHDITQRKQMEDQLEQERNKARESDRLKSVFLQNISHEIRTPMNAIIGFSDLLNTPEINQEKKQGYIKAIQQSTSHLLNIINDLVDISVLEAKNVALIPTQVTVNKFLQEIELESRSKLRKANKPEVELQTQFPQACNFIAEFDKQKLLRIVHIFVDNAIKFTSHGTITLKCIFIHDQSPASLSLLVEDTGIGIPNDKQEAIFAPFRQVDEGSVRKFGGNGLGLTIAEKLCQLLRGEIAITSEEQIGTKISITIPVYNLKAEKAL